MKSHLIRLIVGKLHLRTLVRLLGWNRTFDHEAWYALFGRYSRDDLQWIAMMMISGLTLVERTITAYQRQQLMEDKK